MSARLTKAQARAYLAELRYRLVAQMVVRHKVSVRLAQFHVSLMSDLEVCEEMDRYRTQDSEASA